MDSVLWLAIEVYRMSPAIEFFAELELFTEMVLWSCLPSIIIRVSGQMGAYIERNRQV